MGPYEILSRLGAGGMGEVWRGRDTRLGREVAIKVLPSDLSADTDRLKRFEREARAASSLSHPNIVTVYQVERIDSTSLIVMELVGGKTLREVLADGPLPMRKLLAIAPQIADGLARAHAAGIVHRDLKPENVMVTEDGLVKILDFGLAKLTRPEEDSAGSAPGRTVSEATRPGIAMGTIGYMSPEQAAGHPVDFRSDQFSFGSVLYEMATGKSPFKRGTTAQTLAAIIDEEPEPLGSVAPRAPAPLRWVIERCLSKEPKRRYASTEDLARELTGLKDHVSELSSGAGVPIETPRRRTRRALIGAVAAVTGALAGMYFLGQRVERSHTSSPRFRQLTFGTEGITTARFAPDGQTIVYAAEREGRPPELFMLRLDSPESRSLGLPSAEILSISSSGQMAILLPPPFALSLTMNAPARIPPPVYGTLAEAPLAGGAPRELLEDVSWADWASDGENLAVIHRVGNAGRIEFPIGKVIYDEESELLNLVRIAPPGNRLVFKDWAGILWKDAAGPVRGIATGPAVFSAWSARTGEIWYTQGTGDTGSTSIYATTPAGPVRLVTTLPGDFGLLDISTDGRVLLSRFVGSPEILGSFPGEGRERNLSYLDQSYAVDLSASGETLLFQELGDKANGIYLRRTDGSPPKRVLAAGEVFALSPDGKFLLAQYYSDNPDLRRLVPTGAGEARILNAPGMTVQDRPGFFPDGRKIYYVGKEPGRRWRVFTEEVGGGKPLPVTPEDVRWPVLLGDGRHVCGRAADGDWYLYPIETGEARKVLGLLPGEVPIQSTPDGKLLYVRGADELRPGESLITTRVYRLDPWTGRRELWKEIPPSGNKGGGQISRILFSADGKTCVYSRIRENAYLVLVEGLK